MVRRSLRLLSLLFVCSFTTALLAQSNLALASFSTSSQLAPGSLFTANAAYQNGFSIPATDVKLTITVPPGFQYEGYTAQSPFSCTEPPKDGQGALVCTASSLGADVAGYVEAELRVDPAAAPGTVITTTATLTASNAASQSLSRSLTVLPSTNLRIAMSAPASATAGDTFPITITVTNDGPVAAQFAELDVTRQGGVSWSAISGPAGWTCLGGTCRIASLPPGTATFTISATTLPSTTLTSVKEQASVYSPSDGDFSDNTATASTTIVALPHAELTLSVVADKTTVILGQTVTDTYTVTNNGPDSATYEDLQIAFPGSLSSVTSTFASCTQIEPIHCTAPPLAAGGVLTASVTFIPDQLGTSGPRGHLQWGRNSQTFGYTDAYTLLQIIPDPAQPADLSAAVTMPSTVIDQDGAATASGQFTVTNAGPWPAQLVTVILDGVSSATLPGFICGWDGYHYTCTTASMAPGSVTGTLTATWPAAPNGTLETTAVTASSASRDPDTTNNSASAKTTVLWQSDLTLQQLSVPSTALAGKSVAVDAHYVNVGPSQATDVKITITIPPGATYDSYSVHFNSFQCTEPPKGGQGDLVCTASSLELANDVIEAVVHLDPADKPGSVITFPATLSCPTALKPSQSIRGSTTVATPANLRVTLSSPATVVPGDSFSNTVTVTNAGPGNALNVVLSLTAVSDFTSEPAGWSCNRLAYVPTCTIASFPPGTATFTYTAGTTVTGTPGPITQTATVTTVVDPDVSDNTATSTTMMVPGTLTPVSLQFTASPDSVTTGGTLTYTARIANMGSVAAKNVELWLYLPGAVQTASCGSAPVPHCTFPTIAAGATQTVTATTQIYAAPGTTSVYADAILVGANFLNNIPTTTVTTTVGNPPPNTTTKALLVPTITADKTTAVSGELVTQTFTVTNQGPDAANDVALQINLPSGAALTQLSTTFPSCSGSAPIQCTIPQLVTGGSLTTTVTFKAPSQTGTFASTGAVSWANNGASPGTAAAISDLQVAAAPAPPARRRAARH